MTSLPLNLVNQWCLENPSLSFWGKTIIFNLKLSKRNQMGSKMSQMVETVRLTILDRFGPLWNVDKPSSVDLWANERSTLWSQLLLKCFEFKDVLSTIPNFLSRAFTTIWQTDVSVEIRKHHFNSLYSNTVLFSCQDEVRCRLLKYSLVLLSTLMYS